MLTYYSVLGIKPDATTEEIKSTYKQLAIRNHPDKGGSEELMKMINLAAETLGDPKLRAEYDLSIGLGRNPTINGDAQSRPTPNSQQRSSTNADGYRGASNFNPRSSSKSSFDSGPRLSKFWDFLKSRYFWIAGILQVISCILILSVSGGSDSAMQIRIFVFAIMVITIAIFLYILNLEHNNHEGKTVKYLKILFYFFTIGPIIYLLFFSIMLIGTILITAFFLIIGYFILSLFF